MFCLLSGRLEADNAEGDSDGFIPILTGDEDSDSSMCMAVRFW